MCYNYIPYIAYIRLFTSECELKLNHEVSGAACLSSNEMGHLYHSKAMLNKQRVYWKYFPLSVYVSRCQLKLGTIH
jgi:hypothetical protein